MTDYLAKPFDEARLFRVISRNLTLEASRSPPFGIGAATALHLKTYLIKQQI
jgi:hypothetical protein